ncbi:MAG: hypothetical protein L6N96_04640 [Candidatus Methylarchaceae archaeon HK02M2]|nr:hypothetical protein [Candidatus Methylarchaceae archaeon HK02M2]
MSKALSGASWNVEHFKKTHDQLPNNGRVKRVISFLRDQDSDQNDVLPEAEKNCECCAYRPFVSFLLFSALLVHKVLQSN